MVKFYHVVEAFGLNNYRFISWQNRGRFTFSVMRTNIGQTQDEILIYFNKSYYRLSLQS